MSKLDIAFAKLLLAILIIGVGIGFVEKFWNDAKTKEEWGEIHGTLTAQEEIATSNLIVDGSTVDCYGDNIIWATNDIADLYATTDRCDIVAFTLYDPKFDSVHIDTAHCEDLTTIYITHNGNTNLYELVDGIITPVLEIIVEEIGTNTLRSVI